MGGREGALSAGFPTLPLHGREQPTPRGSGVIHSDSGAGQSGWPRPCPSPLSPLSSVPHLCAQLVPLIVKWGKILP